MLAAHLASLSGANQKAAATFIRRPSRQVSQGNGKFSGTGHTPFIDTRRQGGGGRGGGGLDRGSIIVRGSPLTGNTRPDVRVSVGSGSSQDIYTLRGSIENLPAGIPSVITLPPGIKIHSQDHSRTAALGHGSASTSLTKNGSQNKESQGITTILVSGGNAESSRLTQSGQKNHQQRPVVLTSEHKKPIYITTLKPKRSDVSLKTGGSVETDSPDQKSNPNGEPLIKSSKGILVALGEGDGPLRLVLGADEASNIDGGAASIEKLISKIEGSHFTTENLKKEHREQSSEPVQGRRTVKSVGLGQTKFTPHTFGSGLVSGNRHSFSQIATKSSVGVSAGRPRITASDVISDQFNAEIRKDRQKQSGGTVDGTSLISPNFRQVGGLKVFRGDGGKIVTLSGERPGGTLVQTQDTFGTFNRNPSGSVYIDSQGRQLGPIGVHYSQEGQTNPELSHQGSIVGEGHSEVLGGEKVIYGSSGQGIRISQGGNRLISTVNGGARSGVAVFGVGKNAFTHSESGEIPEFARNHGHSNNREGGVTRHDFIGTTNNALRGIHPGPRGRDNTENVLRSQHTSSNFRSHVGRGGVRNQENIPVGARIVIDGGKESISGVYNAGQGVSLVSSIAGDSKNTVVTSGSRQGSESIFLRDGNEHSERRPGDLRSIIEEVVQNGGKANFKGIGDFTNQSFGETIIPINFGQLHQGGAPSGTEGPSSIFLSGTNGNVHRFGGNSGDKTAISQPPGLLGGLGGHSSGRRVVVVSGNEGKEHRILGGHKDEGKTHGAIDSGHVAITNKGQSHVSTSPATVSGHHQVFTLDHKGTTEKEVEIKLPLQDFRRGHFSAGGLGLSAVKQHSTSSSPSPVDLVGTFRRGQTKNNEGFISKPVATEGGKDVASERIRDGQLGVGHVVAEPGKTRGKVIGITQIGSIDGRGAGQVVRPEGRGLGQVVGQGGRGRERVVVPGEAGRGYSSTIGFGGGAVSSVSFNIGKKQG